MLFGLLCTQGAKDFLGGLGLGMIASQLADLRLGELLDTPPPGLDEAVAIAKVSCLSCMHLTVTVEPFISAGLSHKMFRRGQHCWSRERLRNKLVGAQIMSDWLYIMLRATSRCKVLVSISVAAQHIPHASRELHRLCYAL